jgi:hypothetical protein
MTDVKYNVVALAGSCIVTIHVPIARAALSPEQGGLLDAACEAARAGIARVRDGIALEVASGGVCPFCNDLSHPEGAGCQR